MRNTTPVVHSTLLQRAATCRHCGKAFPVPLPDPTRTEAERIQSYMQVLNKHLAERHREHFEAADLLGREYAGSLMTFNFNLYGDHDKAREFLRRKIHAITRRAHVTDKRIDEKIREELGATMTGEEIDTAMQAGGLGARMAEMMRTMRDVLIEAYDKPEGIESNPYYVPPPAA